MFTTSSIYGLHPRKPVNMSLVKVLVLAIPLLMFGFSLWFHLFVSEAHAYSFVEKLPQRTISIVSESPVSHKAHSVKAPEKIAKALQTACTKTIPGDAKCPCVNAAIFQHDSSFMTAGVGKKTLNGGNMRVPKLWKPSVHLSVYHSPGNGDFAKFDTMEDGITANVELYARNFARYTTAEKLVKVWTNNTATEYVNAVKACF